ncbi:MAG: radical SAM protein [Candidatus Omnitrophota bacterium]
MKIRHRALIYKIRKNAEKFPMMCVVGLSYVCNARCPSCPYTNSDIRSDYKGQLLMKDETFKIIADQCGQHNAWVRISGGGEPMLHPHAVELIAYAKKVGAKVGLITNGSMLTEEVAPKLLAAKIDMVEFSVDAADKRSYERLRKGLKWAVLLTNVRRMIELRDQRKSPTKIIASGVDQKGVDIDRVAAFWEKIVDDFQRRKYLTWAINDPGNSANTTPYLPPELSIPCPFLFERLNIDSRGKVSVCGFDIAGRTDMGNVHEKSIREIWHGKGFKHYRKMHLARSGSQLELCKNCPDWKYRSWKHNYWKIVNTAEKRRRQRVSSLDVQDSKGCIVDDNKEVQ